MVTSEINHRAQILPVFIISSKYILSCLGVNNYGYVLGDATNIRVIWYPHRLAKPIFTDGLQVPAGCNESVLVTFPS